MRKAIALLVLNLILSYQAVAQFGKWQPVPTPTGNDVFSIACDDSVILVSALSGVYRSSDEGETWKNVVDTTGISSITLGGDLAFAQVGELLLRSNDAGKTWNADSVASKPAFIDSGMFYGRGISRDSGKTWSTFPFVALSLAFDGRTIVAGADSTVYLSTDYGTSWSVIDTVQNARAYNVAVSGQHIVVGWSIGRLRCSPDLAHTWIERSQGLLSGMRGNMVLRSDSVIVFITDHELVRSHDFGLSWDSIAMNGLRSMSNSFKDIYLSALDGFWRSTDDGISWQRMNADGMAPARMTNFASLGQWLFAIAVQGLFRTNDLGMTWQEVGKGLPAHGVGLLQSDSPNLLLSSSGLFQSIDSGLTFKEIDPLPKQTYRYFVSSNNTIVVGGSTLIFRSSDGGAKWEYLDTSFSAETIAKDGNTIVMSGPKLHQNRYGFVYLSTDVGRTWTEIDSSNPGYQRSILVHGNLILNSDRPGLYRYEGTPYHWTKLTGPAENSYFTNMCYLDHYVFGLSDIGDIYCSNDSGTTWTPISDGLASGSYGLSVIGRELYAGTGSGIYRLSLDAKNVVASSNTSSGLNIWPNPSSGEINIVRSGGDEVEINIFDELGREVLHRVERSSGPIRLSLSAGVYRVIIKESGRVRSQMIVIE